MAEEPNTKHIQETFLNLGDEFLLQYFICADRRFRERQLLSRLFAMGHSLELYAKAALVAQTGEYPHIHKIPELLSKLDPSLNLSPQEVAAGKALFSSSTPVFNIPLHQQREALELYIAEHHLPDLKYYLDKFGKAIFQVRMSLILVNFRYLELARRLRAMVPHQQDVDRELLELVGQLGFEANPAVKVVSDRSADMVKA